MRVIVTGSRNWTSRRIIRDAFDMLDGKTITIVHGACPKGADALADEIAQDLHGFKIERHPAKWKTPKGVNRRAGFDRNTKMAKKGADLCLAFWDGYSAGTKHMIGEAKKQEIPVKVYLPNGRTLDA